MCDLTEKLWRLVFSSGWLKTLSTNKPEMLKNHCKHLSEMHSFRETDERRGTETDRSMRTDKEKSERVTAVQRER